jgi:hypothetical protein
LSRDGEARKVVPIRASVLSITATRIDNSAPVEMLPRNFALIGIEAIPAKRRVRVQTTIRHNWPGSGEGHGADEKHQSNRSIHF